MARRPVWGDVPRDKNGQFAPRTRSNNSNNGDNIFVAVLTAIGTICSIFKKNK